LVDGNQRTDFDSKPSEFLKKNRRTGFENLPSTVSPLESMPPPQNLPVLLKFFQTPKMGQYFDDVKTRGWLISKLFKAPGIRG
jgi:hypothetical protein